MTNHADLERDFRAAWHSVEGDDFASVMARRSLEASASQTPELEATLFELTNAFQAELDLHLNDSRADQHSVDASKFAELIRGISDAVKEVSKSAMNRQRRVSHLLVTAPMPGSVRIVLRVPAPLEKDGAVKAARSESQDSQSLAVIATLLARSEAPNSGGPNNVLSGLASQLPIQAHAGLRRAAKAIATSEWKVDGVLRRAQTESLSLHLSKSSASALLSVLDEKTTEETEVKFRGHVDGQRRSVGAMWFLPEGSAPIEAAVVERELIDKVAALSASDVLVDAIFNVVTRFPLGSKTGARRSYALKSLKTAGPREVPSPLIDL